jgi:hypothetical protein
MTNGTDEIIYDIRLHNKEGELFHCEDCSGTEFRQVTDIEQGAMGYEVYECKGCRATYRCVTIGVMNNMEARKQ